MRKEEIYLDLSKCTEEQQEHLFSLLPPTKTNSLDICEEFVYLNFTAPYGWFVDPGGWVTNKTELSYPEFIKLLEGGEVESKPIELNISKEDFVFNCDASRQNLNGRESEQEIFLAGIESVIEELGIKFNSNQ